MSNRHYITINGDENTQDIIRICEAMKDGDYVMIEDTPYQIANLPEFLNIIDKRCSVNLDEICGAFEDVITRVSLARHQQKER